MEKHITVVAVLTIVYRSFVIVGAAILIMLVAWLGTFINDLVEGGFIRPEEVPMRVFDILPLILLPVATVMVIVSIAGITGAIGVLKRREWGRIVLLVVSFITLFRIPLGTALGAYGIWVLLNDETVRLFRPVPPSVSH